jgi:hypothetical protein
MNEGETHHEDKGFWRYRSHRFSNRRAVGANGKPMSGATIQTVFSVLAVAAGAVAALLWWRSARIDIPIDKIKSAYGSLVGVEEAKAALREAASWNAWAATATAIAALFQALSLIPSLL